MERVFIKDLRKHIGETVKVQGWLQTLRDQKKMQFLVVRDLTGPAKIELGVIMPLAGEGEPALKIGTWIQF